jgi:hypothetical protein
LLFLSIPIGFHTKHKDETYTLIIISREFEIINPKTWFVNFFWALTNVLSKVVTPGVLQLIAPAAPTDGFVGAAHLGGICRGGSI